MTKELFEKAENAKDLAEKMPFEKIDVKNDKVYINKCEKHDAYMLRVDKHVHNVVPSYVILLHYQHSDILQVSLLSRTR